MVGKVKLVKQTTTDLVYAQLKQDIIDLVYAPGERLSEVRIAERYGVSRDPVRKAVAKLEQESLVTSKPQFGTIVNEISLQQGVEVCDIRLLLESYAVEIAAREISDEQAGELQAKYIELKQRLATSKREEVFPLLFQLDRELHAAIHDACGNETLKATIGMFATIIQRIRKANVTWAQRERDSVEEMGAIIEALCAHDPVAARQAMAVHIGNIRKTVESINRKNFDKE
jgi:DNA-binding GntR family transcriptional regulator